VDETIRPDPERSDVVFERLRGADPAARVEPDRIALDAAVRARVAAPADALAVVRARRWRGSWLAVAAVAAGTLVIGSAGFALGHSGGGGGAATTAGAVITIGQGAAGQGAANQGAGQSSAAVPAPELASGRTDSASLLPSGYGGRTIFTATGLSGDAGSAQAWTYEPSAVFSAETANRIARALGLTGSAALVGGAWTVGPTDGSGPSLQVQPDGVGSLNYYDPTLNPHGCPAVVPQGAVGSVPAGPAGDGAGSAGSGASSESVVPAAPAAKPTANPRPEPPQTCTNASTTAAPQGDDAIAKVKGLIGTLGLDAGAFEYEAQDSGLAQSSYVTASQVVGGERTGAALNIGLVGGGVELIYGPLAPVSSLGSYDVVSAQEAVARLTDPRFGASYGGPLLYAAGKGVLEGDAPPTTSQGGTTTSAPGPQAPVRTPPPAARPGAPFAWPVTEVRLTSARLGLTMSMLPDGTTVLLPAYALSSADGQSWSVLAVAGSQLNFAPAG